MEVEVPQVLQTTIKAGARVSTFDERWKNTGYGLQGGVTECEREGI